MAPPKHVALVFGASRGIGRQVAIDLARDGYAVVLGAKSTSNAAQTIPFPPDPNSPQSTINTVEREIREAGGEATAIAVDVRYIEEIGHVVSETVRIYGSLDVLVYNSGAIWWSSVEKTPLKRFQLMQRINPEGLYASIQASLPYFKSNGWRGRIIVVSPPIYSRFFRGKTAYAMGKVGMSVLTKGLAMEFTQQGHKEMAITSIWPGTAIESAATEYIDRAADQSSKKDLRKPVCQPKHANLIKARTASPTMAAGLTRRHRTAQCLAPGASEEGAQAKTLKGLTALRQGNYSFQELPAELQRRRPAVMAAYATVFSDAIVAMLKAPTEKINGLLVTDEDFLREQCGVSDFTGYSVVPGSTPRRIMPAKFPVLEVAEQDEEGQRVESIKAKI